MIQYTLLCENKHTFDAWFKSSSAYNDQRASGILECPMCASGKISKALMAPSLANTKKRDDKVSLTAGHPEQEKIRAALKKMRQTVETEAEYVGDRFADEARKIAAKETENRGIYGEATVDEVKALVEDGVDFVPLPTMPEDLN